MLSPLSLYKPLLWLIAAIVFFIRLYILLWHGQLQIFVAFESLINTISIPLHKPCSLCVQLFDLLLNGINIYTFEYNNLNS